MIDRITALFTIYAIIFLLFFVMAAGVKLGWML